ncbi:hypothetical protein LXL04_006687 [Taraxacum kok-saghyz]
MKVPPLVLRYVVKKSWNRCRKHNEDENNPRCKEIHKEERPRCGDALKWCTKELIFGSGSPPVRSGSDRIVEEAIKNQHKLHYVVVEYVRGLHVFAPSFQQHLRLKESGPDATILHNRSGIPIPAGILAYDLWYRQKNNEQPHNWKVGSNENNYWI